MSYCIPYTVPNVDMASPDFADDLEPISEHAFQLSNLAALPVGPPIVRYAPSTSLAHIGHSQSEPIPDHQILYANNRPPIEPETTPAALTWDAATDTYDTNGHWASLLPSAPSVPNYNTMIEPFSAPLPVFDLNQPTSGPLPVFDIDQPASVPGSVTDTFGLPPPLGATHFPALVAPAVAQDFSTNQRTAPQLDLNSRLHCPLGCAATFKRRGDRRRHMRKHEPPRYKCAVIECDKTFARADKLRDHMRQGHRLRLA